MVDRTFRGLDAQAEAEFMITLAALNGGRIYGKTGEAVSQALRMWTEVSRNQLQTTSSARSKSFLEIVPNGKMRGDVIRRIEKLRVYFAGEESDSYDRRRFPDIMKQFGVRDQRTVQKYWELLVHEGKLICDGYVFHPDKEWLG